MRTFIVRFARKITSTRYDSGPCLGCTESWGFPLETVCTMAAESEAEAQQKVLDLELSGHTDQCRSRFDATVIGFMEMKT